MLIIAQVTCYEASCNSTTDVACACTDDGFNAIASCLVTTCGNETDYYSKCTDLVGSNTEH